MVLVIYLEILFFFKLLIIFVYIFKEFFKFLINLVYLFILEKYLVIMCIYVNIYYIFRGLIY